MKFMPPGKELIKTDYSAVEVPDSVKNFRPDIYKEGYTYYTILGSNEDAIIGSGSTVDEAMKNWDGAYWNTQYKKD
jgi:hypothetical protein